LLSWDPRQDIIPGGFSFGLVEVYHWVRAPMDRSRKDKNLGVVVETTEKRSVGDEENTEELLVKTEVSSFDQNVVVTHFDLFWRGE